MTGPNSTIWVTRGQKSSLLDHAVFRLEGRAVRAPRVALPHLFWEGRYVSYSLWVLSALTLMDGRTKCTAFWESLTQGMVTCPCTGHRLPLDHSVCNPSL